MHILGFIDHEPCVEPALPHSFVLWLAEVQQLLGDLMEATMRELEELWEQGEAEMASVVGDDQGRTARLRQEQDQIDFFAFPPGQDRRCRAGLWASPSRSQGKWF